MTDSAINTFKEVEVVLFLVDEEARQQDRETNIFSNMLKEVKTPKILIINKIDADDARRISTHLRGIQRTGRSLRTFSVSQRCEGTNVDRLLRRLSDFLGRGAYVFPGGTWSRIIRSAS